MIYERELELFWVCKGTARICIENEEIQVRAGDVLLIRPDRIHGSNDFLKEDLIYRTIQFSYEFVGSMENDVIRQNYAEIGLFMKNINHYITENYINSIELSDAAKHVSMSKGYFCRYFKHAFHMTFHEYLTHVWLREAENLVRTTHLGMEEIAIRTGFSNSNYLTVSFKKHYHMIPTRYRNEVNI